MISLLCQVAAAAPLAVWIDVDTSAGVPQRDIDDAVALIQAFHSPELKIVGVSTVFGNAPLKDTDRLSRELSARFGPPGLPVFTGASHPGEADTPAAHALAEALAAQPLTVLALGPATNLAVTLRAHPELKGQLTQVIAVAGRRPGQRFTTGDPHKGAHRDFNFEQDPEAFQTLLDLDLPLTLAGWELSSTTWITETELAAWRQGNPATQWLAAAAPSWIELWRERFGVPGFNPFDTLAVAVLTHPELMTCELWPVAIQTGPDDTQSSGSKPYLVASPELSSAHSATYCHNAKPSFTEALMARLLHAPTSASR